jgi:hypothetical protein
MSIQLASKYSKDQPYHQYYDLDCINNATNGTTAPVQLQFNDIRNSPYINCPENYFMSLVRFYVESSSLPIMLPAVEIGQSNPNKLIYSVSMRYVGVSSTIYTQQTFLTYVPYDTLAPVASAPTTYQDVSTTYYYIYSYQQWIKMINTALASCITALNASVVAAANGDVLPSTNAPFMIMDPNSFTTNMNADISGFNESLARPIELYFNTALWSLYNNYQWTGYGNSSSLNGRNYKMNIYNNNGQNSMTISALYTVLVMFQEQPTVSLLNPVSSIVFTTGQLPVVPSLSSTPILFNSSTSNTSGGNNANISPIISDFEVPFSALDTYKPNISYSASAEYRLIDLYGNSPLNAIQITVSWKDFFGNIRPLYLLADCVANLKIMFRRKDFNSVDLGIPQ